MDSGADGTLLSIDFAVDLGLDPKVDLVKTSLGSGAAAGMSFETWDAPGQITGQVMANVGNGPQLWGPTINFAPVFAENAFALLGRKDFFAHFAVTFENDPLHGAVFHLDC